MKLNSNQARIVQAALVLAVEKEDVLWDDLSEDDLNTARDLLSSLESVEDDDDGDGDWEDDDSEEEEMDEEE